MPVLATAIIYSARLALVILALIIQTITPARKIVLVAVFMKMNPAPR
jgi:hypothetical protein